MRKPLGDNPISTAEIREFCRLLAAILRRGRGRSQGTGNEQPTDADAGGSAINLPPERAETERGLAS